MGSEAGSAEIVEPGDHLQAFRSMLRKRNDRGKGSLLLTNQTWQPLPGTGRAEIYPYLRKPDLLSSNSCLIRTPEQIILIDAGALAHQTADLGRVIRDGQREGCRPLIIYLTHCHIDHSLHVGRYRQFSTEAPVWVAVQESGGDYLITGDRAKTIAELYGATFPSQQPDIRLLTAQDLRRKAPRQINLAPGVQMRLRMDSLPWIDGKPIIRQTISMGGGDDLEIYPAPGHSPDSICIRIGEVLFIGDLLTAANPMVAGISGWNKDHLVTTLEQVTWLLDTLPIHFCCPGHGGMMDAKKARSLLQRLKEKTRRLGEVDRMNEDRLFGITDFALELIDEAEEVFSSIAGRLLYVAHHLELLEEEEAACRCRAATPMEQIDASLLEFRRLCHVLESGKIRRVEFAFGVLSIVEKIRSLFDSRPLQAILPRPLVHRAMALLMDFIGIARGCRNLEEFIPTDLNALIEATGETWQIDPHLDASIVDQADDYEEFLAALVRRIGQMPSAARPVLHFLPQAGLPLTVIAAARFSDTLLNFLDWLAQSAVPAIRIATSFACTGSLVTITPEKRSDLIFTPYQEKKIKSFGRRFRLCGLNLKQDQNSFRLTPAENDDEKAAEA